MPLVRVSNGGTVYTTFTPTGQTGTTAGTNFTPGKYYILVTAQGSSRPTSITGARIISYISGGFSNIYTHFVQATASTIKLSGGGTVSTKAMHVEIG